MAEVAGVKNEIEDRRIGKERLLQEELRQRLAVLPNLPADDVPFGADENDNIEVVERRFGSATRLISTERAFDSAKPSA